MKHTLRSVVQPLLYSIQNLSLKVNLICNMYTSFWFGELVDLYQLVQFSMQEANCNQLFPIVALASWRFIKDTMFVFFYPNRLDFQCCFYFVCMSSLRVSAALCLLPRISCAVSLCLHFFTMVVVCPVLPIQPSRLHSYSSDDHIPFIK